MAKSKRKDDDDDELFDVDDGSFHWHELKWQRIGRIALAVFIAAGFLGFFGSGPLSSTTTKSDDSVTQVRYERWVRAHAPTELRLITTSNAPGQSVRLWLDQRFLEGIEIKEIVPEPTRTRAGPERIEFELAVSSTSVPEIIVRYQHLNAGMATGTLGVADRPPLRFRQYAFP